MGRLLTAAAGFGLIAIGTGAIVAPRLSSGQFGLRVDDEAALAFVRAAGVRDAVLGALIVASRNDPPSLRRILAFSSLLGLADAVSVAALRGPRPQHVLHLGGFLALLFAARTTDR